MTRRTRSSRRASLRGGGETPLPADVQNVVPTHIDRQEIASLPVREGDPMSGEACEIHIRQARVALERKSKGEAVFALLIALELAPLYFGFAEVVKGFDSFAALARELFGLTRTDAYDYVRFSRYFTEETAAYFGKTIMRHVPRLMDATGITSMEGLLAHEFETKEGSTFRLSDNPLPTTRAVLSALDRLENPPTKVSRKLEGDCRKRNAGLAELYAAKPVLKKAGLKWVPGDGEAVLKSGPLTKEQRLALAKYILEVDED